METNGLPDAGAMSFLAKSRCSSLRSEPRWLRCAPVSLVALPLTGAIALEPPAGTAPPRPPRYGLRQRCPRCCRDLLNLALCLLQVSLGFILNDWITLLYVAPLTVIFHYGIVLREERYLSAKFDELYLQYKRELRR